MAGKNVVTLTMVGDHKKLTESFEAVGDSAKTMDDKVSNSTGGFDKATDASDTLDTRAMGFRDTVTGVEDSVKGFSQVLKGDFSADALVLAGTGVGDLASGFTNLLGPALGRTMTWLAQTRVGMLAHAAMTKTVGAATKVWTGIQAAFNFVMALNPIVLVIIAIVLLVAIIIIAYKKSETFRKIVDAAFRAVVAAAKAVWEGVKTYFGFWKGIIDKVMGWVGDIPGRIGRAFRGLGNAISAPFRAGFDAVRTFWNNVVGGKGFDIPSWVPGVGGKSFRFPRFHGGGVVPGAPGSEMLAILQAGERVVPAGGGGGGMSLTIRSGGSKLDDVLVELIAHAVRDRGGNVQVVLGGG
jgi:prophage DNA circulation protein